MGKDSSDLKDALFTASDAVIGAGLLVFLGVVTGNWLDSKLHTSPFCVVCLSLLGAALGLWRMVRKAMKLGKSDSHSQDPLEQPPPCGSALSDWPAAKNSAAAAESSPSTAAEHSRADSPQAQKRTPEQGPRSAFDFLDQGDSQ